MAICTVCVPLPLPALHSDPQGKVPQTLPCPALHSPLSLQLCGIWSLFPVLLTGALWEKEDEILEVLKERRELLALPRGGDLLPVAGVPGSRLGCSEAQGRAACQLPLKAFFGTTSCLSLCVCLWRLHHGMTHLPLQSPVLGQEAAAQ